MSACSPSSYVARCRLLAVRIVAVAVIGSPPAAARVVAQTEVVAAFDQAPVGPEGLFRAVEGVAVLDDGGVVFAGDWADPSGEVRSSLWHWDPVLGTTGFLTDQGALDVSIVHPDPRILRVRSNGRALFRRELEGGAQELVACEWLDQSCRRVVTIGQLVPVTEPSIASLWAADIAENGRVALIAKLADPASGEQDVVFAEDEAGSLVVIADESTPFPGREDFTYLSFEEVHAGDAVTVFNGATRIPDEIPFLECVNEIGRWSPDAGLEVPSLGLLPSFPCPFGFLPFSWIQLDANGSGDAVVVRSGGRSVLYCPSDAVCEVLLGPGDPIPGMPGVVVFSNYFEGGPIVSARIDEAGQAYVIAKFVDDEGFIREVVLAPDASGAMRPRVVEGQPAPDRSTGTLWGFRILGVAESGRMLLYARVGAGGAFYVSDPDGSLLYVAPGGGSSVKFAAADAALERLLFRWNYVHRTELQLVSVPEPGGAPLGAAAVVALRALAARRRPPAHR